MIASLSDEIWKDIPGYEGLYQASSIGRIRNYRLKVLKPNLVKSGYYHITLSSSSIPKTYRLHRIIGYAFIPQECGKPQINHINGIKTDNRVENLEWCTHSENQLHSYKNGLNVPKRGSAAHNFGLVRGLSPRRKLVLDTNTGIFYDCMKDAADAKCLKYSQIKNRLHGRVENNTGLIYA